MFTSLEISGVIVFMYHISYSKRLRKLWCSGVPGRRMSSSLEVSGVTVFVHHLPSCHPGSSDDSVKLIVLKQGI